MARAVHVHLGATLTERRGSAPDAATRRLITRAARAALRDRAIADADMSITLLDDAAIGAMNAQYLAHDGPTDVISFALYAPGEAPVGDIYIGLDEAARQARARDLPIAEELARLAVHGVLHVLGYDHPSGEERLSSPMWEIQENIVAQVVA